MSPTHPASSLSSHPRKSQIGLIFRVAVTIGLVGLLLWQVDWVQTRHILSQYGLQLYLYLIPITAIAWAVYVWRWKLLLAPLQVFPSFWEMTVDSLVGLFYGLFVPTGLAGDAVRAIRLGRRHQALPQAFLAGTVDRLMGLWALLLLFGVQLATNPRLFSQFQVPWLTWLIVAGIFFSTVFLISRRLVSIISQLKDSIFRRYPTIIFADKIDQLWQLVETYSQAKPYFIASLAVSILYQLLITFVYYAGANLIGVTLPFGDFIWIVVLVTLVQLIPITVAGLGVRESAFIFFLGWYQISATTAVALSLIVFSVSLLFGLLGGLLSLIDLKQDSADA